MKAIRILIVVVVLIGGIVLMPVAKAYSDQKQPSDSNSITRTYNICGTVTNATPAYSDEAFAILEKAVVSESQKEFDNTFEETLSEMYLPQPLPNIMVTLLGKSLTKQIMEHPFSLLFV
jgi:hypothetical protein